MISRKINKMKVIDYTNMKLIEIVNNKIFEKFLHKYFDKNMFDCNNDLVLSDYYEIKEYYESKTKYNRLKNIDKYLEGKNEI